MLDTPHHLKTIDQYEAFVSGEFPNYLGRYTNLSVIGIFESEQSEGCSSVFKVPESIKIQIFDICVSRCSFSNVFHGSTET